ncbi:hypothetical protein [Streptomonospora litoralis]|uniref:Uncharacterized protein n=1 Tax=Streptomonospora litoralis TaxID=2498135 RepID=A0A4P6Q7Q9_9ACTN|nr:hypothetical protein [Streptomonospora litoralis]QBI56836.1 hypothetical protein EKD16_25480 [Streptomonospora litoralis]
MRRPRTTCPYCSRTVALTTADLLYPHHTRGGAPCPLRHPSIVVPPGGDDHLTLPTADHRRPIRNVIRSL